MITIASSSAAADGRLVRDAMGKDAVARMERSDIRDRRRCLARVRPGCRSAPPRLRSATIALALTLVATDASAQDRACTTQDAITTTARSVTDGRSFLLADGREVRLAAIEVPLPMRADAAAALSGHVVGRSLRLAPLTPPSDRWGRLNMHAFGPSGTALIEAALLAQGLAVVSPGAGAPCLAVLRTAERNARRSKAGLWGGDSVKAASPAAILANRGGFAVVEGRVASVRESGGTIYLNFGRRWSEDFTVTILKRNERRFTDAGVVPKLLEGRTVRVRGVIEERGGPWIEAETPEQIETDQPDA